MFELVAVGNSSDNDGKCAKMLVLVSWHESLSGGGSDDIIVLGKFGPVR